MTRQIDGADEGDAAPDWDLADDALLPIAALEFADPGYNGDKDRCAVSHGAVIVAAAGNNASDKVREYPAAEGAYGLLAVAASTSSQRLAAFTNSGNWIDLAAPGDAITSSVPGGRYGTWSGTSMAAPLVAGTAALVRSTAPALTARDLARRLVRTTTLCGTWLRQVGAAAAVADVGWLTAAGEGGRGGPNSTFVRGPSQIFFEGAKALLSVQHTNGKPLCRADVSSVMQPTPEWRRRSGGPRCRRRPRPQLRPRLNTSGVSPHLNGRTGRRIERRHVRPFAWVEQAVS